MKENVNLGVVLLAAGKGERFGSNKLLADCNGRPMVCCALEVICAVAPARVCVVAGCDEVADLAERYGCVVVGNDAQHLGQSHSIHLGLSAMADMDAVLLMVADQPRLTTGSLVRLVRAFRESDCGLACLRDETHMGNPAIFAAKYRPALLALSGDRGAKGILRTNAEDLLIVDCESSRELDDADTPQALAAMQKSETNT